MEGLCAQDLLALRKCTGLRALELVGGHLAPLQPPAGARLAPGPAPAGAPECPEDSSASSVTSENHSSGAGGVRRYTPTLRRQNSTGTPLQCPRGRGWGWGWFPTLPWSSLVLNRMEFEAGSAASLALSCPSSSESSVSGPLCSSCLYQEGPCRSPGAECVRNQVDHIQQILSQSGLPSAREPLARTAVGEVVYCIVLLSL